MVRAILDGKKSQTRRVINPAPKMVTDKAVKPWDGDACTLLRLLEQTGKSCPYGQPGDRLWVRETCRADELPSGLDGVRYLADDSFISIDNTEQAAEKWGELACYGMKKSGFAECRSVPSIHMPRWASRILLEVTAVRVERLQDISEDDAQAEGARECDPIRGREVLLAGASQRGSFVLHYRDIWESINGAGSWLSNPWVWVIEFERVKGGAA